MAIAFFRTIILYLLIIIGIRLMGKRQVGELEPSELVLALLISDLAAVPMQDFGIPLLFGAIPILTLLCITMILSVLTMKSIRFRALVCGRPSIVIHDGVLQQREMRKNRLTLDELNEELRLNGIVDIASVRYGILETNGRLSTILFPAAQPVTAEQMNLSPGGSDLPSVIINDGRLMSRNLHAAGLDLNWVYTQLNARGVSSIKDVFLMTVDSAQRIYFAKKEMNGQ